MRRILLSCASAVVLLLPAAASAGAPAHAKSKPGFLVVKKGAGDGGINGRPVITVVLRKGFVLGRVSTKREASVEVYHLPSTGGNAPQSHGANVPGTPVRWRGLPGRRYSGTGFRFRAIGGFYRVVVRGSGVYLFAGGRGNVKLRGSSQYKQADGTYSINGAPWHSLPGRLLKRELGRG
jgi:hypothetical protein